MIDISTIKLAGIITGSSVALLSMLHVDIQRHPQKGPSAEITEVIQTYVKAGDNRNTVLLDSILHEHFRVVANQLLGSSSTSVITKDQYLKLIEKRMLGGDTRAIDIQSLEVIGNNASVKVKLTGNTLTFESFYHLIQSSEGDWHLLQDLPYATKNKIK